jgi:dipeptide/tripeptide permease
VIPAKLMGAIILGAPLIALDWALLGRQRRAFWFGLALVVVGVGYLAATGATDDIAILLLGPESSLIYSKPTG